MGKGEHDGALGAVYAATSPEAVAAVYDRWAETYEAEMRAAGYRHPLVATALLARHMPPGGPVLDAGCGTGLLGEWLGLLGYRPLDGLDLSEGMLAVAARKRAYRDLIRTGLGGPLPLPRGGYAGIVSAGVFTTGHVGPAALPGLAAVAAAGAVFVVTVKTPMWDDGFAEAAGGAGFRLLEVTEPYVSMPGETGTIPSRAAAFRRD